MVNDLEPVTIEQIHQVKRKICELKHTSTMRYEYQILEDQLVQMLRSYAAW